MRSYAGRRITVKKKCVIYPVIATITLAAATVLSGCGSKEEEQAAPPAVKEETAKETETAPQAQEPAKEIEPGDHVLLSPGADIVYIVDGSGRKIREYDLEEIRKYPNLESFYVNSYSFVGEKDGVLIFYESNQYPWRDEYGCEVYAVDTKEQTVTILDSDEGEGIDINRASLYKDAVYTLRTEGGSYHENMIEGTPASGLKVGRSPYDKVLSKISRDQYDLIMSEFAYERGSVTQSFTEAGYLLVFDQSGEQYLKLTSDGKMTPLSSMPKRNEVVCHYDAYGIVYEHYQAEGEPDASGIYYLDLQTDQKKKLLEYAADQAYTNVLTYHGGLVYVVQEDQSEYGHSGYLVVAIDPQTGTRTDLFTEEDTPGIGYEVRGGDVRNGLRIISGDLYYPAIVGSDLKWVRVGENGEGREDIGCPIQELPSLKLGQITYESDEIKCPYCGTTLYRFYAECFRVNDDVSPESAKINADLKDAFLKFPEQDLEYQKTLERDDSECEEHKEYPDQYGETYESRVGEVKIMRDRYLVVYESSYWYGGGAHGQPGFGQFMYDLNTGRRMTIQDFFDGSEEDFKKLCAEKTVENMQSYGAEESPYFETDPDIVYQSAYEQNGFLSQVDFMEDGVYLVYPPYEMGPFASGFIEVKLLDDSVYD